MAGVFQPNVFQRDVFQRGDVTANAELASGTGAANVSSASLAPNAAVGSGTGSSQQAVASLAPNSGSGSGTGASGSPTSNVQPSTQASTGTGASGAASTSLAPNSGSGSGTGASGSAASNVQPSSQASTGTGSAFDNGHIVSASINVASGTGSAGSAAPSVASRAAAGSGAGSAGSVSSSVAPTHSLASGAGTSGAASAALAPSSGVGSGSGASGAPTSSVQPSSQASSGAGTVGTPSSSVASSTSTSSGTGSSGAITSSIAPNATTSAGSGSAGQSFASLATGASVVSGTGAAGGPTSSVQPSSGSGSGTGSAFGSSSSVALGSHAAVGRGDADGGQLPYRYLPIGPGMFWGYLYQMERDRWVVGQVADESFDNSYAALWDLQSPTSDPVIFESTGYDQVFSFDLYDDYVLGSGRYSPGHYATLVWSLSSPLSPPTELYGAADGYRQINGSGIDEHYVVGGVVSDLYPQGTASLWDLTSNTSVTILGEYPGQLFSRAKDIRGDLIVGYSYVSGEFIPVYWDRTNPTAVPTQIGIEFALPQEIAGDYVIGTLVSDAVYWLVADLSAPATYLGAADGDHVYAGFPASGPSVDDKVLPGDLQYAISGGDRQYRGVIFRLSDLSTPIKINSGSGQVETGYQVWAYAASESYAVGYANTDGQDLPIYWDLNAPFVNDQPNAGSSVGTGSASNVSEAISVNAGSASGTGTANDATGAVGTFTNASAGTASGTGTAYGSFVSVASSSGAGSGSGAASSSSGRVAVGPSRASGTGASFGDGSITVLASAIAAAATAVARDATVSNETAHTEASAEVASGTGTAYDAHQGQAVNGGGGSMTFILNSRGPDRPITYLEGPSVLVFAESAYADGAAYDAGTDWNDDDYAIMLLLGAA